MNQWNNSQQDTNKSHKFFNSIRSQVLALLCATAVIALSVSPTRAGVAEDAIFEMSVGGGFAIPVGDFKNYWDTLGANTGFEMDFSGGYFLTPNLSIGLALEYAQFTIDNPNNPQHYRLYTFGGYGKYFSGLDSRISPYLRVQGGITIPNFSAPLEMTPGEAFRESGFDLAFDGLIGLGARISTSDKGGIYLEAAYRYTPVAGSMSNFGNESLTLPSDVSHIQLTAGIGFDFGPKQ